MKVTKGVLIDLGGVVYQGNALLDGSAEAIGLLREAAKPFRFLTNTTSQPLAGILAKLEALGLPTAPEEIFTPAIAARAFLAGHGLEPECVFPALLKEDLGTLPTGGRPAVVIGDARENFTYATLNDIFRRIEAGAEFIALASNRQFVDADGRPSLDVGAFVAALEYATGKTAVVLGKPSAAFFHLAVADMGLRPGEAVMIGDDAEFDVAAAIEAGLGGYLVHTGKWRQGAADGLDHQPTGEFANLLEAVRFFAGR